MAIYLLATLDTKGTEAGFLQDRLVAKGHDVTVVDTGSAGPPTLAAEVGREQIFAAAGSSWDEVQAAGDRGQAVALATRGAAELLREHWQRGQVDGVLGIGGSAGTSIGTSAMRALPIGVPKLMVSTMASGNVRSYVADKDICMLNSIVDIAGINRISRMVLGQAADAMSGMVLGRQGDGESGSAVDEKPLVAASMFGVTTPCVQVARELLEKAGYEVLVFHATGTGGQAMESLIRDGLIAGVLDLTTTELADELVGGVLSAGKTRLTAAGESGVPQVISVGALDMVNFGAPETVPGKFHARRFYQHNPVVTLMRTTPDECRLLGEEIGRKATAAKGPTWVLFPAQGVSAIDREGQAFDDPQARESLREGLQATCDPLRLEIMDAHINDETFARHAAQTLIRLMAAGKPSTRH